MNYIFRLLDQTTMYRVVLYALLSYVVIALGLTIFNIFSFSLLGFALSLAVVLAASSLTHYLFAYLYDAPANYESTLISALIIFLLLTPKSDTEGLAILALVSFMMVVSKYVVAWRKLHIFNPVALALVAASLFGLTHALWWIGNPYMFVPVLIGGLLITIKLKRFPLVLSSIISAFLVFIFLAYWRENLSLALVANFFLAWPILFFATLMVTEPLSTPAGTTRHIMYGSLIGALSSLPYSVGPLYSTPELALLIGNIVFYPTMLKARLVLTLKEIRRVSQQGYEYIFHKPDNFSFEAGQYLEWTLPHEDKDNRGIRRYLTIASSPSEDQLMVGLNIPDNPSSFKKELAGMQAGDTMYATSLSGDFVLPDDMELQKLVFIGGGVGVTPFRSMIKYMIDANIQADITLFYCDNDVKDIMWDELWQEAQEKIGLKAVYVMNVEDESWEGERGFVTKDMLEKYTSTTLDQYTYYISGPPVMVNAYTKLLKNNGIASSEIVTDFFPGL